ncbi:MAG: hypothetical protein A4E44_00745 [Methanosaeta sp. PtaB.Bin018]|nr:MAG: hypothetical protein A4E44_00745 [Methanosaeta sp. PtaB.Bin018]
MRVAITLVSMLVLLGLASYGFGSTGSVSVDIIGSKANNTTIVSQYGEPVNLEIIGSAASNIKIVYPEEKANDIQICDACGQEKRYITPWDDFRRPLCYPWSSYIPTRYNRLFFKDQGYSGVKPKVLTLGGMAGS